MSEEPVVDAAPAEELPLPPGLPGAPSWLTIFAGFSFVATLMVLAGILAVRFAEGRPANLVEPSERLSALVERTLIDHYVPSAGLEISAATETSGNGDQWRHYVFDAVLPNRLDPDGVAQLVRDDLERSQLTVQREGPASLSVWLSNYQIASVNLRPAPASQAGKLDLRVATSRLAEQVAGALVALGAPESSIYRSAPVTAEDNEARWYRTTVEARLPDGLTQDNLYAALEEQIAFGDATLRLGVLRGDTLPLEVRYRDRPCVDLMCSLTPGLEVPEDVPTPRNAVPLDELVTRALAGQAETAAIKPIPAEGEAPPIIRYTEGEADGEVGPLSLAPVPPKPRSALDPVEDPVIAIILDDGGYGGNITERILDLDSALTLSILPNTPYGAETADLAADAGFEVMLHMPMESHSTSIDPFPGQIEVAMSSKEIVELTERALEDVPGAVGANNHTGSKFTSDPMRMEKFLELLRDEDLFFVDSMTRASSVGHVVAEEMGIPFGKRDVFLDDDPDPDQIRKQFAELVRVAKRRGFAIGIGHFRDGTVTVLEEELPKLKDAGVRLVPVSEVLQ